MGAESNPFDFQKGTSVRRSSVGGYAIAGVIVLIVLGVGYWFVTNIGNVAPRYSGKPIKVDDEDLWTEFLEDERNAKPKYIGRFVEVTGVCSEAESVPTPEWAISNSTRAHRPHGKKETPGQRLKIGCFIPNRDKTSSCRSTRSMPAAS